MAWVFTIVAALLASLALSLILAVIRHQISSSGTYLPVTAEWLNNLSVERYGPMLRLLDVSDLQFLRRQPGYTLRVERNLRLQRIRIFRGYLRSLQADFNRICAALGLILAAAQYDRSDLASVLMCHQVRFACAVTMIQFRLALYRWGLGTGDAAALLKLFDSMRLNLRILVPAGLPGLA